MRYWLTPPADDAQFDAAVRDLCSVYRAAPGRAAQGARTLSTDELTGVQALERAPPGRPMAPGHVEGRAFEDIRHGTRAFIRNRAVVSGQGVAPSCGPTRTEADFLAHIVRTVATDPAATRWRVIVDNLNIHCSERLVRWGAVQAGLDDVDLGEQEKRGILKSMASRAACRSAPRHRIVFQSTPKPRSWLNQIELWRSILTRKLLTRGHFTSLATLEAKVLAFIDYYNQTMAKPFQWTYHGKPLHV